MSTKPEVNTDKRPQFTGEEKKTIKPWVFWPPFLLLLGSVILSFWDLEAFAGMVNGAFNWSLGNFGWFLELGCLAMVFACIIVYFSPLGKIKLGGPHAQPLLTTWKWFSVTLCTGIAIGLLFWGTAEPMFHLTQPPASLGIEPNTPQAGIYAISTLFMHWTLTPYAIYTVPAIICAFVYYNMRKPYSVGASLYPILGEKSMGSISNVVDVLCLYALVAGMAATLGVGTMSITKGLNYMAGIPANSFVWLLVIAAIVTSFLLSSISGLNRGIQFLANQNAKLFIGLLAFVFLTGPTFYILNIGTEALGDYFQTFMYRSLFNGAVTGDEWPKWWIMFNWAAWLAWAPLTGIFIGRISYGRTIRQFIIVTGLLPAVFGMIWMSIFGGSAVYMELVKNTGLAQAVMTQGPEYAVFGFLKELPLGVIIIPIFIFASFLSYVTGADAMTSTIGGLSVNGITPKSPEPPKYMKILWGVIIGSVSWTMISFAGIDGIKMLSVLGGFPIMFLEVAMMYALLKVAFNPTKYEDKSIYEAAYLSETDAEIIKNAT